MTENSKKTGRSILFEYLLNKFDETRACEFIEKFDDLTVIYNEINSVINISAIKSPDEIYIKHYLDSVYPYSYFSGECCDVGCGGGFPCLPLAIVGENNYTGIDGVGKKLNLIHRAAAKIGLNNINALHIRAEELVRTKKFDTVCARAVSDIDKTLGLCAELTKKNGTVVLYRTQNDERANLKTEKKTNTELFEISDYVLPQTDIKRRLYIYKKNS